ncbi:MAG: VCBS repeat-containing protein [Vicinamibacterales bacterium]|nr:VCBS repeat-containing protein [Vicinamibacterales bacterium]
MKRHVIAVGALLVLGSVRLQAQAPAPCASPSFKAAVNIDTGLFASGVAIGDFNLDGVADMAVTNQNSNNVSILLGDGTGGFRGKADLPAGGPPQRIAAADLDGDGKLDLVLPIQAANAVAILWGDGKGGFGEPAMFAVEGGPFMPVIADFNVDRRLDVAVTTRTAGSRRVAVLSGNGMRSFHAPSYYGLFQSSPPALGVGDFNRDGTLDLAAGGGINAPSGANNLSIFLGDGKGGFGMPSFYTVGQDPQSMSIADFNGDGFSDIAISNSLPIGTNSTVSVLLGDGKGGFAERIPLEIGVAGRGTGAADFNGDGNLDLVVANNNSNTVSVLLGDGRGRFAAKTDLRVGTNPRKLTVGDLNGDGKADIVTPNTGSNNVSVLINNCTP